MFAWLRALFKRNTAAVKQASRGNESPVINDARDVQITYSTVNHSATETKEPPKLYKFPPLTRFFSQRDNELIALHTLLQTHKKAVVYGMGGLGKSELVNQYARKHQADYAHLFWLSAESSDILQAELRQLAQQFGIDEKQNWFELLQVELNRHADGLLILDNLDEFASNEWKHNLAPLIHKLNGCSLTLLITSRCEQLGNLFVPFKLEFWQATSARRFLLERTNKAESQNTAEETALQAIIREFAGLPLGLEQAGAYISENRGSFVRYWQIYQTEKNALLEFEGLVLERKHKPLLITLQLALEKQSEAARQMFNLCAFLNGDEIPEEIVEALIESDYTAARNALLDYSLLEQDADNRYLRQHRLLQSLAKSFLKTEEQKAFAEAVIAQVVTLFPNKTSDISNWQTCQRLLISALACDELSRHFAIENEAMALLYNQLALYLQNRHANYAQALTFCEQACKLSERLLGHDHLDFAASLNNLASLYYFLADYEKALPICLSSLAILEQQLGKNHSKTGMSYGILAGILEAMGDYNNALIYRKKALDNHKNSLRKEHPITALSMNNLAKLYSSQSHYDDALPLYQCSLAIDEKVYGKEHHEVATDLNNIAALYEGQGRYDNALQLYQRALAIMEKRLGTEHPTTKIVAKNYALLLEKMSESGF